MAIPTFTTASTTFDFKQLDIILGAGFRVDAYDTAGVTLAWQGDAFTVAVAADDINVIIATGSTYAIITINMMQSAAVIDYVSAWVDSADPRPLSLQDRTGRTVMAAAKAIPRQKPNMGFSNTHSPRAIDIHCPNLTGVAGGLNP